MQLGTRWSVGGEPPRGLPEPLLEAARAVEGELSADGVDAASWRWTLTWLEGRPIAELDDGTRLEFLPAEGTVRRLDAID
ncbi:MAG: hypothetical protein J0G30_10955 [Actinomycetales bacterium]|nr:hypothetical protein [Actinomycetales bacterium]